MMEQEKEYILSTQEKELFRLGVQHQVWASEAQMAWERAGIKGGDAVLDLGCGPGFCSKELAFLVGEAGKVYAVDQSQRYLTYLNAVANQHNLPIQTHLACFDELDWSQLQYDAMYCRWAMAWIPNPEEILSRVFDSLHVGGKMILHEYYDWTVHQTYPKHPALDVAISKAYQSFEESPGDINIGRRLPGILAKLGMKNIRTRPLQKIVQPNSANWQWPKTFYEVYFPILADTGYLTKQACSDALQGLLAIEKNKGATICCPLMIEVIAEK